MGHRRDLPIASIGRPQDLRWRTAPIPSERLRRRPSLVENEDQCFASGQTAAARCFVLVLNAPHQARRSHWIVIEQGPVRNGSYAVIRTSENLVRFTSRS